MNRLVLLLEEPSMRTLLEGLLPRLFPDLVFTCIPHEGKQDLERSIPRKLRGWQEPGVRFMVLRDNDNGDCVALKSKLQALCDEGQRPETTVRIVCQELEAWYFGDPGSVAAAYGKPSLVIQCQGKRFRNPDAIVGPGKALKETLPEFQKISGARLLAAHLGLENGSTSYQHFLTAVARFHAEQQATQQPES